LGTIAVCMTDLQHNIVWYKELIVLAAVLAGVFLLCRLLQRAEDWIARHGKAVPAVLLLLYGAALYVVSCVIRNEPAQDYGSVYQLAYDYVYGEVQDWFYLALWKNNFPLFWLLTLGMRICKMTGSTDPFYFLLFFNVLFVLAAAACLYGIAQRETGRTLYAVLAMLLFIGFLPVWGETGFLYTDSVSMLFTVLPIWILGTDRLPRGKYWLAGAAWGLGTAVKATVLISLAAVLICAVLKIREIRLRDALKLAAAAAGVLILAVGLRMLYPCYEMENQYDAPIEYWLALGCTGNGGYSENEGFALACLGQPDIRAKREYARQYLAEHLDEACSTTHITRKMCYNFASGNMGWADYNRDADNVGYQFFNDYGKYGGYMTMISTAWLYATLLLGIGGQAALLCGGKNRNNTGFLFLPLLTVFGLFLFLMLWEANNRQLYNHIPWYVMTAVSGINALPFQIDQNQRGAQ